MAFRPFTVEVPATSANLGPGYDSLGIAIEMANTVRVEPSSGWEISGALEGGDHQPLTDRNLLYRTIAAASQRWGLQLPTAHLLAENVIPLSRGLGSSSAAIVAGLLIADRLGEAGRPVDEMLNLASEIEGHPDNVAPALLGGVQACALADGRVVHARVPLGRPLRLALYIPDAPMPTREARKVVPRRIETHDAVYNISRACLLVAALASGKLDALRAGTQDMLHQPPRMSLFPTMPILFHAALEAGALGVYLSGAGSTIVAFVEGGGEHVASAMERAAARDGVSGRAMVSAIREGGATIRED